MKNPRFAAAFLAAALLVAGVTSCGKKDNPVDPRDRVCGGESGFGARVTGRASPVDVCVSDDAANVILTTGNEYSIHAVMNTGDDFFQFDLLVARRDDTPTLLTLHDTEAAAAADDFGVWIYYQEAPTGGEAIESYEITDGDFTLSFSADDVLTATFNNITFKMRTQTSTPEDRGTRVIEKGFLSLSVDS